MLYFEYLPKELNVVILSKLAYDDYLTIINEPDVLNLNNISYDEEVFKFRYGYLYQNLKRLITSNQKGLIKYKNSIWTILYQDLLLSENYGYTFYTDLGIKKFLQQERISEVSELTKDIISLYFLNKDYSYIIKYIGDYVKLPKGLYVLYEDLEELFNTFMDFNPDINVEVFEQLKQVFGEGESTTKILLTLGDVDLYISEVLFFMIHIIYMSLYTDLGNILTIDKNLIKNVVSQHDSYDDGEVMTDDPWSFAKNRKYYNVYNCLVNKIKEKNDN